MSTSSSVAFPSSSSSSSSSTSTSSPPFPPPLLSLYSIDGFSSHFDKVVGERNPAGIGPFPLYKYWGFRAPTPFRLITFWLVYGRPVKSIGLNSITFYTFSPDKSTLKSINVMAAIIQTFKLYYKSIENKIYLSEFTASTGSNHKNKKIVWNYINSYFMSIYNVHIDSQIEFNLSVQ